MTIFNSSLGLYSKYTLRFLGLIFGHSMRFLGFFNPIVDRRHKPDLLLFISIAGTGDLLSKHALGIL